MCPCEGLHQTRDAAAQLGVGDFVQTVEQNHGLAVRQPGIEEIVGQRDALVLQRAVEKPNSRVQPSVPSSGLDWRKRPIWRSGNRIGSRLGSAEPRLSWTRRPFLRPVAGIAQGQVTQ